MMRVIDQDPELLERSAAASLHASEQTTVHVDAEIRDVVPEIIDTLVQEGPLAYLVLSEVLEDGSVRLPFASTVEGIAEAYEFLHNSIEILGIESSIELRGEWYTFHEGIAPTTNKATREYQEGETIAIFPSTTGKGITGELVWSHRPPAMLGRGATGAGSNVSEAVGPQARREVLRQHERYMNALRNADIEGILEVVSDDAQTAIRDYVNETGTLTSLDGKEALRAYYTALFDKYEIRSADVLRRVAREWYVFAEVRMVVGAKHDGDPAPTVAFNTAEMFAPGHDGRFVVRIGHGTDPAPRL